MLSILLKALNRLFHCEEMNGRGRCPTYLYRWHLFKILGCGVYLHRFVGEDWSRDPHDHPKRFFSLTLWGSYVEEKYVGGVLQSKRRYRAPWLRSFPATHSHRIIPDGEGAWTLVVVLRGSRDWGFWNLGKWYHWRSYVLGEHSQLANDAAICMTFNDKPVMVKKVEVSTDKHIDRERFLN